MDAAPARAAALSTSPAGTVRPRETINTAKWAATHAPAGNDDGAIVVVMDAGAPGVLDGVPILESIVAAAAEDVGTTLHWVDGATMDATESMRRSRTSTALVIALDVTTPETSQTAGHPLETGLVRVKIVLSVSLMRAGRGRSPLWHDEATMTRPTRDAAFTEALKELAPKMREALVEALSRERRR